MEVEIKRGDPGRRERKGSDRKRARERVRPRGWRKRAKGYGEPLFNQVTRE